MKIPESGCPMLGRDYRLVAAAGVVVGTRQTRDSSDRLTEPTGSGVPLGVWTPHSSLEQREAEPSPNSSYDHGTLRDSSDSSFVTWVETMAVSGLHKQLLLQPVTGSVHEQTSSSMQSVARIGVCMRIGRSNVE